MKLGNGARHTDFPMARIGRYQLYAHKMLLLWWTDNDPGHISPRPGRRYRLGHVYPARSARLFHRGISPIGKGVAECRSPVQPAKFKQWHKNTSLFLRTELNINSKIQGDSMKYLWYSFYSPT